MSKKKNKFFEEPAVEETVVEEPVVEQDVVEEEIPEEPVVEEIVNEESSLTGVVVNCSQLNVRKRPDKKGEVRCVLNKNDEVTIIDELADGEWLDVLTKDGVNGYCMKAFIQTYKDIVPLK